MPDRVTATPEALEVIERLRAAHGPLVFHQSGGCCDGTAPMCLAAGDLPGGANDTCLGEIGGVPYYIDADQDRRWGRPDLVIAVAGGAAESFSLEGREDVHFVTRTTARCRP